MVKKLGNESRVISSLAHKAVKTGKDRQSLYSECVRLFYQATGRLSCGFDSKDLQMWIDINYPNCYDKRGKYIEKEVAQYEK